MPSMSGSPRSSRTTSGQCDGIIDCAVPPLLAIILAIATRQVILSLFAAVYVGATMLCDGNPWEGLYSTFFDYILPGFEDTDHQRILALTTFCRGFSLLLEKSGGAKAFADRVHKGIGKTRRGAQILTWFGGMFIWFSDSTNPVLLGPICRTITDKVKVSREKLAYMVDSTTAAVPTLFPVSAWGAYIIGLIATFYTDYGYDGDPQSDFISGIPYQYYTIGCVLMVLIIAVTGWDYGPMKKAEGKFVLCSHISKFTFGFFHRAKPVTEVKRSGTEVHCGLAGSGAELN